MYISDESLNGSVLLYCIGLMVTLELTEPDAPCVFRHFSYLLTLREVVSDEEAFVEVVQLPSLAQH